ncbi:E3 ubiquitin-protein ligase ATL41-like [Solanum dulcamara]|uniref:E3 ubiquitin-protein ligase ATL41-like n=1 Tax=Solanum dulcamara TaxID=45834 RepID=UPI002486BF1D|nr:E3 ubiquitin-protein ligase ATL41-like [Solanum dulcamara]
MGFDDDDPPFFHHKNKYDLNSKIMISAIISLSLVVFFVTLLHIYARYVLRRQARRRAELQRVSIITSSALQIEPPKTGLDPSVIASLPVFIFNQPDIQNNSIECTVCLSVLENGETARTLPNCKHVFHAECIDKWFGSHSTCPICRTEAEPRLLLPEPREGVIERTTPSAPPIEGGNSKNNVEGIYSDCGLTQPSTSSSSAKISGSSSRLSSFRRMITREKSSRRLQVQFCGVEDGVNDLERQ